MLRLIVLVATVTILYTAVEGQTPGNQVMKLGTLATENSDWGKALKQMNAELISRSDGTLRFQFYFGRDEKDLISLIKSKQIDGVSVSIPGLGRILPEVFIFQSPMLFMSYEELDYVRDKLSDYFSQEFQNKGYTLLGWGDLGFAYIFSKQPIKTQTDFQKTRLWVWDIDPIAKAYASASGAEPILLPVQNVLSSIEGDDVQTVYGPPLACIVYQWHSHIKYMTDLRLAVGVGATIIRQHRIDQLSADQRTLLKEVTEKYHLQLVSEIRKTNEESIEVMKEQGMRVISIPHREKLKWQQVADKVRSEFVGQLYGKELLDKVNALLEEYHQNR
jgi:TRAP-type C4-dicarboxylate transport system substrate-binding protein